ncbi:LolA-related protein [Hydrogenophaga sp. T2]|uniref:LolA-related protein n=1 Tax=Hydrogenophaga sp. T2 TaxID=3132823 RepID=UPI003CEABE4B
MITRRIGLLALLLLPLGAARAADDIDRLMAELAANPGGTVRFVEKRHMAMFDKPLESSGEMSYYPPDWLERRTLKPRPERVLLEKDTLTVERERRRFSMPVSQRPEVMAFVASVRSTLAGDRVGLERHYALAYQGNRQRWTLTLVPREPRMLAIVTRIAISGEQALVRHIEYQQADGDRSEMSISAPVSKP